MLNNLSSQLVINKKGKKIIFDEALKHMDEELCAQVYKKLPAVRLQRVFDEYSRMHYTRYGEEWDMEK